MNFQDLKTHLETYGCHIDHLEDNLYLCRNCITAHVCEIEDLTEYSEVALCHYFYELGVSAPTSLKILLNSYRDLRESLMKIPLKKIDA